MSGVRRILVVRDVRLWTALQLHFSGTPSIELLTAESFHRGLVEARKQRADFLVCSLGGHSLDELQADFVRAGLDGTVLVCIHPDASSLAEVAPAREDVLVAGPDDFLETLARAIDLSGRGLGVRVELLARFVCRSADDDALSGFANVLELSDRELLLESEWELEVGDVLDMSFFLTRAGGGPLPRIGLQAVIRRTYNEDKLLYVAETVDIDDEVRVTLRRWLRDMAREGGSEAASGSGAEGRS